MGMGLTNRETKLVLKILHRWWTNRTCRICLRETWEPLLPERWRPSPGHRLNISFILCLCNQFILQYIFILTHPQVVQLSHDLLEFGWDFHIDVLIETRRWTIFLGQRWPIIAARFRSGIAQFRFPSLQIGRLAFQLLLAALEFGGRDLRSATSRWTIRWLLTGGGALLVKRRKLVRSWEGVSGRL